MRARALLFVTLLATACAAPGVDVTVSEPKVFGDDQVLRSLFTQRRRLLPLASGIRSGDYQESLGVGTEERTRTTLGVNLADPSAPAPEPPGVDPARPRLPWGRAPLDSLLYPPLQPGLTFNDQLRQRVDGAQLLSAYELLFLGDARLLDRRSRAALLRFDLSFNNYVDLGERRRFVVVEFVVKGKRPGTPRFSVYLLSPEYSAMVSQEQALTRLVSETAGQVLASWGGIGFTGSRGSRSGTREELEALLETPLQFAIYDARPPEGGGVRFAFAFGPRRRLNERGRLNPARWFGSSYEIAYEVQPGPRSCQALLVFEDVALQAPLELLVSVVCDGQLVAEEEVDVARALHRGQRPLQTFEVRCPPGGQAPATQQVRLDPRAPTDVLLCAGPDGPTFTPESEVFVGGVAVPRAEIRFLGRGRLAVHVSPHPALAAVAGQTVPGRAVTPDQPDFAFQVQVAPTGGPK